MTDGEHKFDRRTYRDIGYFANVGLSLGAVFWAERTHMGRDVMSKMLGRVQKILPSLPIKTAEFIASKSLFLTGGFAILIPMKRQEDHKVEAIKRYDREIYGDAVDTDPVLIKAHRDLEAAPKQSWASILGSRITALIPFYAVIGLPWANKSKLSQLTNREFRALDTLDRQAQLAMEKTDLSGFAQRMNKGWFIDKPIVWAARTVGKLAARLSGNAEAVARIETMGERYPGMLKEGAVSSADRDPNHSALPYYFISEMITSALVARGVYLLTRVFGPLIGRKPDPAPGSLPAMPVAAAGDLPGRNAESPAITGQPQPRIETHGMLHADRIDAAQREAAR